MSVISLQDHVLETEIESLVGEFTYHAEQAREFRVKHEHHRQAYEVVVDKILRLRSKQKEHEKGIG